MKPTSKALLKFIGYPLCFIAGLQFYPAYEYFNLIIRNHPIQTVKFEQTGHDVTLFLKNNVGDINFIVKVDNVQVYESPDFAPYPNGFYQEHLIRDVTGQIVVLKLLGKKVFAYNTATKQEMKKGELKNFNFLPDREPTENYAPFKDIDE